MKKLISFIASLSIFITYSYSQITFEPGYFINESNQKTECLIKNSDWYNNPTTFEYKLSQNDLIKIATLHTVKEFGINGSAKYISASVKIDRSSNDMDKLTSDKNPEFHEEQLFLKVLIEGKASLFLYKSEGSLTRLFYKINDTELNQLVYKKYLKNSQIAQNDLFKQQLYQDLKGDAIKMDDFENIQYNPRDLKRLFIKYNESINSNFTNYEPTQKKDVFKLL